MLGRKEQSFVQLTWGDASLLDNLCPQGRRSAWVVEGGVVEGSCAH